MLYHMIGVKNIKLEDIKTETQEIKEENNLNIVFIGTINIFPNINKKNIQAIYAIILLESNIYHLSLF